LRMVYLYHDITGSYLGVKMAKKLPEHAYYPY